MKVFNEDLFNNLSGYDYKDLNHMDDIKSFEDFIRIMGSFGVEFKESDFDILRSISKSDDIESLKLKLSELGLEVSNDDLKEVLRKLDKKEENLLSDEDLNKINGGAGVKIGLFTIGLITTVFEGVAIGAIGYGTYETVKIINNRIKGKKK